MDNETTTWAMPNGPRFRAFARSLLCVCAVPASITIAGCNPSAGAAGVCERLGDGYRVDATPIHADPISPTGPVAAWHYRDESGVVRAITPANASEWTCRKGYEIDWENAQAMEARRAETQSGSVNDSAVRQDAPETPLETEQ